MLIQHINYFFQLVKSYLP